jgi:4-methyl-5(b-hydroxyethyl)-thiazole monophosphate biosynthesis
MARVSVLLANGFEEIEAVTIIDVLRRAGVEVVTLGVDGLEVTGSHAITIRADRALEAGAKEDWDMVILPGGLPGAHTLRDHPTVQSLLTAQHAKGKALAAICAAPIALGKAGVLSGRRATSYPGFESELTGATCSSDRIVMDGNLVTSRGPGTALEFSLELAGRLAGRAMEGRLRTAMLVAAP